MSTTVLRKNSTIVQRQDGVELRQADTTTIPLSHLKTLNVSDVKPTSFNPPSRRQNTQKLEDSIRANGQQEPVHVVIMEDGSMELADGNRRHRALQNLGEPKVRALVYTGGRDVLERLYVELNSPKMTLKNSQMTAATILGGPTFNTSVAKTAEYLKKLFAEDERAILIKNNVGPYLVSVAKKIANYSDSSGQRVQTAKEGTKDFDSFVKKSILWLNRHRTQQKAIAYMRLGFAAPGMRKAIDSDKTTLPRMG